MRSLDPGRSLYIYVQIPKHGSSSSVGLAGADGEFPVTRAATELMHDLRRKKIHYDFPCFMASFISLFILVGLGSQLLGG